MANGLGHFYFRDGSENARVQILVFGPRNLSEHETGLPNCGFALYPQDNVGFSQNQFADFLNAALAASHGDFDAMNIICPPKKQAD